VRAKVGDRYVLEELVKNGWDIGGESSGHLLDISKHTTGDGTISALLVLQALARSGRSMQQLLSDVTMFPQHMINVRLESKDIVWNTEELQYAITQRTAAFGDKGRILIRASGTEPVVRVMVEHENEGMATDVAAHLADVLKGAAHMPVTA